jgi:hypothetical protein
MDKVFFKNEYDWVINVLSSCKTLEQVQVSRNLFNRLIEKWKKTEISIDFSKIEGSYIKIESVILSKMRKKVSSLRSYS